MNRTSAILAGIVLVAGLLRFGTFYLPHAQGDQLFYTALALKLAKFGMDDYNLRGVDFVDDPSGTVIALQLSDREEKGRILESLERKNIFYYTRETLSNMPPLYSYALMWSHRLFGADDNLFLLVRTDGGWNAIKTLSFAILQLQFYAVWINYALSLLLVFLTFCIGHSVFDRTIGLVAAAFMALNPVDLLTSQRTWADELSACLFAACTLLLLRGMQSRSLIWLVGAGFACGLAIVTKGTGLFLFGISAVFIAVTPFLYFQAMERRNRLRFAAKAVGSFAIGALPLAVAWHGLIYAHYGHPLYMPRQDGIEEAVSWFQIFKERHYLGQLYYFVLLFPVFVLFYVETVRKFLRRTCTLRELYLIFLPLGCLALLIFSNAREERYLLPAYPMIAAVSAAGLCNVVQWTRRISSPLAVGWVAPVLVVLGVSTISVWKAISGLALVVQGWSIFPLK